MSTDYESLILTRSGDVVEIALNRASARNAVNHDMHREIAQAFMALSTDPGVRAIVLAANGKVFCAGGDFELILADRKTPERRDAMAKDARALFNALIGCPIPIVVAMHGEAVGLGATLVLSGDAIVASRGTRISDPHVVVGLAAGDGGCVLWPQAIGIVRAKRYLLTGDRLSAEDAHAMGLVTDLVDSPDEVRPTAHALAARIAALPPLAVQRTKRALNCGLAARMSEVFEESLQGELDTFFTEDVGEAITAMQEKRQGQFFGR